MSKRKSSRSSKSNNSAKASQPNKANQPSKSAAPTQPATKNRGALITIALVIVFLHGIVLTAVYFSMLGEAARSVGNWALMTMFVTSAADIVAAAAMWFWKRWGMLLYGIAAVVQAVVIVLASGDIFLLFGALLPAIIVLYILATRRNQFE